MNGMFIGRLAAFAFLVLLAIAGVNQAEACYACDGGTTQPPAQQQTWTSIGGYGSTGGDAFAGTAFNGQVTPQSTMFANTSGMVDVNMNGTIAGQTNLCPNGSCTGVTLGAHGTVGARTLNASGAHIAATGPVGGVRAQSGVTGNAFVGATVARPAN